jgi:DNA-binding FadR family transcriptional regulator
LARACGNPVMSILVESVFELLIESSLDFLDLSLEKHFFEIHTKIFQLIKKKRPEESEKAIRDDILDVRKKLKGFREKGGY